MNITHVVENLNRGGLERVVIDLAIAQQAAGHHTQVVCLFESGHLAPELAASGIAVHACGKRAGLDRAALARLRKALRAHSGTILHTHNSMAHYQAVLAGIGLPLRCVINSRHGMGTMRASRRELLFRMALHRTDAVVTVCNASREIAVSRCILPAAKVRVIPNGIRLAQFRPASDSRRRQLRGVLGVPANTRVIGTVGRLNWAKNQADLIRAFAQVHSARADTVLVLVGDGELRTELEGVARTEGVVDSIRFLGDRSDVRHLLQGLDLFVLSSVSEGHSIALLEACASALPIIASDAGGNREIIHDGQTGLVVPVRNVEALARAMQTLLDDREQADRLALAALAWVRNEGSLATMVKRYAALYQELMEARTR